MTRSYEGNSLRSFQIAEDVNIHTNSPVDTLDYVCCLFKSGSQLFFVPLLSSWIKVRWIRSHISKIESLNVHKFLSHAKLRHEQPQEVLIVQRCLSVACLPDFAQYTWPLSPDMQLKVS